MTDLCSPFLLHPSQPVANSPKPFWEQILVPQCVRASAELLSCLAAVFISFELLWLIFSSGSANICDLKPSVTWDAAHRISSISHPSSFLGSLFFPCCIFKAYSSQRDPSDSLLLKCYGFSFKLLRGGGIQTPIFPSISWEAASKMM